MFFDLHCDLGFGFHYYFFTPIFTPCFSTKAGKLRVRKN